MAGKEKKEISFHFHLISFYPSINYNWKLIENVLLALLSIVGNGEATWCFSQIKGALDDDVTDADIISCVEFDPDGELLATGDKGGRVVIFQVNYNIQQIVDNNNI